MAVSDGDDDLGFAGGRCGPSGCGGSPAELEEGSGSSPVVRTGVAAAVCSDGLGADSGSRAAVRTAPASGSSWPRDHAVGQDYYLDEYTFRLNRSTAKARGLLFYRLLQQAVGTDPHPSKDLLKPHPNE